MVGLGSGSQREIQDIMLTRFAYYLLAQNGDPRKQPIAPLPSDERKTLKMPDALD